MNSDLSSPHYVEGVHSFTFDEGYLVCRIECSSYYSRQAQNFCGGCKEMDFLLYHPQKKDLWLIEVKDYRFDARPKVLDLVNALTRKVKDTLFLLRSAAVSAPDECPPEGVSLREFAKSSIHAESLHLAFLMEMGMSGVWTDGGILANVKNMLTMALKFIDAEPVCAPITWPYRVGPWRVKPAHGELSKRIQIRRGKKLAEIQAQRRLERERLAREAENATSVTNEKKKNPAKLPLWKQRLEQRLAGETGNHDGRRKKKKHR